MDVSIIIPYDVDRGFLSKAVESAKNQTFDGDFELILSQSPGLQSVNVNLGLKKAKGEFIKILHEDDTLPTNAIQILFDHIKKNNLDWAFSNALEYEKNINKSTLVKSSVSDFENNKPIHGGTTMYKKSIMLEVGGYNESIWTAEEYEFHLRLKSLGYKYGYIDEITYYYRYFKQSKSYQYRRKRGKEFKEKRQEYIEKIKQKYSSKQSK